MTRRPAAFQVGWERYRKSQSGRDHVRRSDDTLDCSAFRLSRRAMVFWCAMGADRSLARYRICRRHPVFFSAIVFDCLHCFELWAGRDSPILAGADLDCFGIVYGHFRGVRSSQIRALMSASEGAGGLEVRVQPGAKGFRAPPSPRYTNLPCSTAASTNEANSGCGANGRDLRRHTLGAPLPRIARRRRAWTPLCRGELERGQSGSCATSFKQPARQPTCRPLCAALRASP